VSHEGVGVAVLVGGAVAGVVEAVEVGVPHGSNGAGRSSEGASLGTVDGVGGGVVDGCARAPAVPEINISATALTVTIERDVDRKRLLRSSAEGFGGIVMNFLQSEE
jgi:hypothetical protein